MSCHAYLKKQESIHVNSVVNVFFNFFLAVNQILEVMNSIFNPCLASVSSGYQRKGAESAAELKGRAKK